MNVTGTEPVTVWINEYNGKKSYSYGVKVTDRDGHEKYAKQWLRFKGGDPGIQNGTRIHIKEAFETGYVDREGKPKLNGFMVMEWEPAEDAPSGFEELAEDVPF